MIEYTNSRAVRIIGPFAEVLTREALPPSQHHPLGGQPQGPGGRRG